MFELISRIFNIYKDHIIFNELYLNITFYNLEKIKYINYSNAIYYFRL